MLLLLLIISTLVDQTDTSVCIRKYAMTSESPRIYHQDNIKTRFELGLTAVLPEI